MKISAAKEHRLNRDIQEREVRLIDADGENKGVVSIFDALRSAEEADLDLVEIVPTAKPPVCRVMDYGKFKFEQNKKAQAAKKKQKQIHLKEIKFRPGTDEGDYKVKVRKLIGFLSDGDKAKDKAEGGGEMQEKLEAQAEAATGETETADEIES